MQPNRNNTRICSADVHNFGRKVRIWDDHWIHKPRPLVWEHLFLDPQSELKKCLRGLVVMKGIPDLRVHFSSGFNQQGLMELAPPNGSAPEIAEFILKHPESGRAFGSLIALSLWFGIHDLHYENISIFIDNDQLRLFPIDLECVFKIMDSPAETRLIPFAIKKAPQAAFETFLPRGLSLDFCVEVLVGLLDSLRELQEVHNEIHALLERLAHMDQLLTRVILRTTRDYMQILGDPTLNPTDKPLIAAERQQLARGDIPYFFRDILSQDILLLNEDGTFANVRDLEHFEYLNKKNCTLAAFKAYPNAARLAQWLRVGSFQIMNFLLPRVEASNGKMESAECRVEFDATQLEIRTPTFWVKGQRVQS